MQFWLVEIKESPTYKLQNIIEYLSKTTFWYHSNDTKRDPWVMLCSHYPISDWSGCFHITVYFAIMLQASWHIAEATNSQKIHISSHDPFQNFIRSTFHHVYNILRVFYDSASSPFTATERKCNKLVCTSCRTT